VALTVYWWLKPEYSEKTIDLQQVTDKMYSKQKESHKNKVICQVGKKIHKKKHHSKKVICRVGKKVTRKNITAKMPYCVGKIITRKNITA
jgi:hypothetical protein